MSSLVKIAKIAPSASIVYQFLVFFYNTFTIPISQNISKYIIDIVGNADIVVGNVDIVVGNVNFVVGNVDIVVGNVDIVDC